MRLLVCGDRNWTNKGLIKEWIVKLQPDVIIEGEARGADSYARDIGLELGTIVERFPAQWETYGRAAGIIRNTKMLMEGKPDFVLAFHDSIATSTGTRNMLQQAKKAGIKSLLVVNKGVAK